MIDFNNFNKNLVSLVDDISSKKFLLAVSGGADSMVLAHLFKIQNSKFQIAHVNYHFREEDSNLDQKLVEDFCKKNNIKFHLKDVSDEEKSKMKSLQNWAREIRYDFFFKILEEENLDYIVTAHHLNDELETFLINLSRGSGIRGLSGIPANENQILRPFLKFSKDEIYEFAKRNNIDFREDKSNKKNDYLRNKIRNEIVPKLLETNENFLQNFGKSLNYLDQAKNLVDEEITLKFNVLVKEKYPNFVIDREKFLQETDLVKFEVLRKFGFENNTENLKIYNAKTGKNFHSNSFELMVGRKEWVLCEKRDAEKEKLEEDEIIVCEDFNPVQPDEFTINLNDVISKVFGKSSKEIFEISKNLKWEFDAEKLVLPLKLRKKKDGDLFFPIGMIGKKKVSKFIKDEKIPIFVKEKIWLLCDGNDSILGVIPYRQDRRFSTNPKTQKIIKITL